MSSWSPWEDTSYCWVVICKNEKFHRHAGEKFGNKIPLAETDAIADMPAISAPFLVRCPDCGEQYSYQPAEILRVELTVVDSFTTHPLFRDLDANTLHHHDSAYNQDSGDDPDSAYDTLPKSA
jgi:hypothetical protein